MISSARTCCTLAVALGIHRACEGVGERGAAFASTARVFELTRMNKRNVWYSLFVERIIMRLY